MSSRNLGYLEHRSVEGESFATTINEIHEQVKHKLEDNDYKYNLRENGKRREVNFEVGELVLAHLQKERFPRGQYNKLKFKKIGPCKILQKFSTNAYELELPTGIGIYPIFNVADLYPYKIDDTRQPKEDGDPTTLEEVDWLKQMPMERPTKVEAIMETKVVKKTIGKEYLEYLLKWRGHPVKDSTWMNAMDLEKQGYARDDLMSRSS